MKIRIYTSLCFVAILTSCSGDKAPVETDIKTIEPVIERVSEIVTPHNLENNDGKKWKVSKGMQKPLKKIVKKVEGFSGVALVDYQLLGDNIGKETSKVISNCDMTGRAHDELHKWLLPFLELKEALVMASSPEEGAAILENIKTELGVFDSYFK